MALALGRSVRELEQSLTYAEYREWRAFDGLEPIGEQRADMRAAMLAAAIYKGPVKNPPDPDKLMLFPESRFYSQEAIWRAKLRRLTPDE